MKPSYVVREVGANELEELGKARRRHLVPAGYDVAHADCITDAFDYLPDTLNLAAFDLDEQICAAVRVNVRHLEMGMYTDQYFDFSPYLPDGARLACGSLLFASRAHRGTSLVRDMFLQAADWAMSRRVSHVCAVVNPQTKMAFARTGWRQVAAIFEHSSMGCCPFVLDPDCVAQMAAQYRLMANSTQLVDVNQHVTARSLY